MKQVYEKRKVSPATKCPWHGNPEIKTESKTSKAADQSRMTARRSSLKTSEFIPSPMLSPSLKSADRENLTGSEGRVFTFEDSGKSFIKKSLESTVYKTSDSYQTQLVYMQQYITYLKNKLNEVEQKPLVNLEENQKLKEEIEYLKGVIQEKNEESNNYLDELCEKHDQIVKLSQRLSGLQEYRQEVLEKSMKKEEDAVLIEQELKKFYSKKIDEYEGILNELKNVLDLKERELDYIKYENKNNLKNLKEFKDVLLEKIAKKSENNEKDFKGLEEKMQKAEDKLNSLSKGVRLLQDSEMFPSKNKLKGLEEEITAHYNKILTEQKTITETLREALETREEEFGDLNESFQKLRKLLEKNEEDLKMEIKLKEEFSRKKNDLENELNRISVVYENEKIEKFLAVKKAEELNKNLVLAERIIGDLKNESEALKKKLDESEENSTVKSNEITEKIAEILCLKSRCSEKKIKSRERKETIIEKHKKIEEIQDDYQHLQLKLKDLNSELGVRKFEIEGLKISELEKSKRIGQLDKSLSEKAFELEELNEKIRDYQARLIKGTQENQEYFTQTLQQNNKILALQNEKIDLNLVIEKKDKHIQEALQKNSEDLIQLEKYKNKLTESKENIKKLENIIKEQSNNFILLTKAKKVNDDELIENKAQVKYLESSQLDTFKTLNEFQLKVKELNTHIHDKDLVIQELRAAISQLNEDHEAKISYLNQNKLTALKEAKSNYDKEKDSHLEKLQKLENFCLELNHKNSEKHEKIQDLVNEFKYFKEKASENEVNMTKTHFMLTEEINSLKIIESKLRKKVTDLESMNSELSRQAKVYESEALQAGNERFEVLQILKEKESEFLLSAEKNKAVLGKLENAIEKKNKLIEDLEFSKKQVIDKWNLSLEESDYHEKELLKYIENLQIAKQDFQRKVNEMSLELQDKEKKHLQNESKLASELQDVSNRLQDKDLEISKLNEYINIKDAQEISLNSEILDAKSLDFENSRRNNKLTHELELLKEKISEKAENERNLTEKLKEIETEFRESAEENKDLLEKLAKSELKLNEFKSSLAESAKNNAKDLEKFERKLFESESKAQSLQSELNKLRKDLLFEQKEKACLEVNYKAKESDLAEEIKKINEKLQVLNENNLDLARSNSELKSSLESTVFKLENTIEELGSSQEKLEILKQKEKTNKDSVENLIIEHEVNTESLKFTHRQQCDSLQSEITNLNLELQQALSKSESFLVEIEDLHRKEETLNTEIFNLQKKIEKNEKVNKIILDFKQSEFEKLEKQAEIYKNQWLAAEKAPEENVKISFKNLMIEKENQIKSLADKMRGYENTILSLEEAKENLEHLIESLKNEINSERALRKTAEQNYEQKKNNLDSLAKNLDQVRQVFDNEIYSLDFKLSLERQKSSKLERELGSRLEEIKDTQLENQVLKTKINDTEKYLENINSILSEEKIKYKELEKNSEKDTISFNSEKAQLSHSLEAISKDLENAHQVIENLKSEQIESRNFNDQISRENRFLKDSLEKKSKETEKLLEKLRSQKESILNLKEETNNQLDQIKKQSKQLTQMESQETFFKNSLDLANKKIKSQELLIQHIKCESEELDRKAFSLEAVVNQQTYKNQKINSLENQLKNLDLLNSELKKECLLLNQEKQDIKEDLKQTMNKIVQENDDLKNSMKNTEIQLDLQEKTRKSNEFKSLNLINQLKCELKDKENALETLNQKLGSLKKKHDEFLENFAEKDVEKLKTLYKSIKHSGKEILDCGPEKIENDLSSLRNSLDCAKLEIACLKNENSQLNHKISSTIIENKRLEDLLSRETKLIEDELSRTKLILKELTLENDKLLFKNKLLEKNQEESDQKLNSLLSEKSALIEKLDQLNESFRQMSTDKDKIIVQLTNENTDLKCKISQNKQSHSLESQALTEELSKKTQKSASQESEIKHLKSELNSTSTELKEKTSVLEKLGVEFSESKEKSKIKTKKLKKELAETSESLRATQDMYNKQVKIAEALEPRLSSLTASSDDQKALIAKLLAENEGLESHLRDFKKLLEESGAFDINALRELIVKLQTQKILDERHILKDSEKIKQLKETNSQKMNNYKISVLQNELNEKNAKIEQLLEDHQNVLTQTDRNLKKATRGLSLIESLSQSTLSKPLNEDSFKEFTHQILSVINDIKTS